jgi:hypothetical protein
VLVDKNEYHRSCANFKNQETSLVELEGFQNPTKLLKMEEINRARSADILQYVFG